jgi:hypothetical protein
MRARVCVGGLLLRDQTNPRKKKMNNNHGKGDVGV